MQTFETTDLKLAKRFRYAQYRGMKTTVTVNGSPVTGIVHSVKEVASSSPARWIVTVVDKQRIAAQSCCTRPGAASVGRKSLPDVLLRLESALFD
jgi:DNA transposition AAA+ family ATPase